MPSGRFKGVPNVGTEVFFEKTADKINFLSGQLELLRKIKEGESTWADMNEYRKSFGYPDTNIDSIRRSFAQLGNYDADGWVSQPDEGSGEGLFETSTVDTDYTTGQTKSNKIIKISDEDISNPELLLKAHGFDPSKWKILKATNTKMNWTSAHGESSMYSSRVVVAPLTATGLSISDIDKFFADFEKNYGGLDLKIDPKQYEGADDFLEVCLQDTHIGLLSYDKETGENYDVDIAKKRIERLVGDVVSRCNGRKYKRIILSLIGDIIHFDNMEGTTTKGTRQDLDTRPSKVFDEALNTLIGVIENLGEIAPVTVVTIPGNHDRLTSYALSKSLEMAFRSDKNVTFYNSPNPRKALRFGDVLIGWAHGDDMKTEGVVGWLSEEYAKEWGKSKYREAHLGHFHSVKTVQTSEEQKHGIIVRYLPALCASSAWEHLQGFPKSLRSLVCFEWNESKGLRSIWYNNI